MLESVAHSKLVSWMAAADGGQGKSWQALPSMLISAKVLAEVLGLRCRLLWLALDLH